MPGISCRCNVYSCLPRNILGGHIQMLAFFALVSDILKHLNTKENPECLKPHECIFEKHKEIRNGLKVLHSLLLHITHHCLAPLCCGQCRQAKSPPLAIKFSLASSFGRRSFVSFSGLKIEYFSSCCGHLTSFSSWPGQFISGKQFCILLRTF